MSRKRTVPRSTRGSPRVKISTGDGSRDVSRVTGMRASIVIPWLRGLWGTWSRFWFGAIDPLSLAVSRVLVGSLLAVYYVALFPNWGRFYGPSGMRASLSEIRGVDLLSTDKWSVFYWTESWLPVATWWYIAFVASVIFTLGWKTRTATVVLWILQMSQVHMNLASVNGEDLVFRMYLFYGMFASLGARLSIDSNTKQNKERRVSPKGAPSQTSDKELIEAWSVRALQIGLALVYAISLPNKLADDSAWLTGDALYYATASNLWSRFSDPLFFYICA